MSAESLIGQAGSPPYFPCGIIADDLTGACDTGAAFARRGFATTVLLERESPLEAGTEVVILNTESRNDSVRQAQAKVRIACRYLTDTRFRILYKKIDSTLKGPVQTEIEAVLKANRFACAIVCPAFPAQGRAVRQATLCVRGEPLVDLSTYFCNRRNFRIVRVSRPISPAKVIGAIGSGCQCVIPDAETERDLAGLVRAAFRSASRVLLVGSAGMARHVADLLVRKESPLQRFATRLCGHGCPRSPGRSSFPLILTGSNNPVTQRQIEALARRRRAIIHPLGKRRPTNLKSLLAERRPVVVRVPMHESPNQVLQRQLAVLDDLFVHQNLGGLVLVGGDTASLITRRLGVEAIELQGEIAPGIPWGVLRGGQADGRLVCTKAGGFGNANTLIRVVDFFVQQKRTTK